VLFYMDAIGLRPRIEEMADRIASWGYVVLAPNVFHRAGRAADLAPTEDLRDPGAREAFFTGAMTRVHALTPDLSEPDARLWVETLLQHASAPIGVTGYCMGARLALRTAGLFPGVVAACGAFHGGGLVTDDPASPHLSAGALRAEVYFGHADQDGSNTPEQIAALDAALDAAGVSHRTEVYAGARHGYTMADTPAWDEPACERHFAALFDLLGRTLTPPGDARSPAS
jgi:carboxymethylenebutenolidase